jgi:hypothetical protein
LTYWTTNGGIIVRVGTNGQRFQHLTGCRLLNPRQLLGRSLLDFVHERSIQQYLWKIIHSVMIIKNPLTRRYCCGSHHASCQVEMELSLDDCGLLKWEHRIEEVPDFLPQVENMMSFIYNIQQK